MLCGHDAVLRRTGASVCVVWRVVPGDRTSETEC